MRLKRVLAAVLTPFMMLLNCPVITAGTSDVPIVKQSTEIVHKPLESVVAGKRIELYTEISDESGVDVVRVYFKSKDAGDFSFIAMKQIDNQEKGLFEKFKSLGSDFKGQGYSGVLPAPANGSKSFQYLILVKNKANTVVKSQTYEVAVEDDKDGGVAAGESVQVYTELSEAPKTIVGFSDNIVINVVESGAKFGAVAGLYSGLSTSGGGTISAGTVAASAGAFTTTALVVGGAAAVAVVGVAAIAGGGSSDSGSSNGGSSGSLNSANIIGTWNYSSTNNYGCTRQGVETYHEGGRLSRTGSGDCSFGYYTDNVSSGTWSLNGSSLTLTGGSWDPRTFSVSGNSTSFKAVYTWTPSGIETTYYTK